MIYYTDFSNGERTFRVFVPSNKKSDVSFRSMFTFIFQANKFYHLSDIKNYKAGKSVLCNFNDTTIREQFKNADIKCPIFNSEERTLELK